MEKRVMLGIMMVYLTVFIDILGMSIILPILPFFARDLDASPGEVGILFSGYSGAVMLSTLFAGRMSDKVGRRPLLLLSLFGSAVGTFFQGFAESIGALIAIRTATGLLGASPPVAQAYIADVTTKEERPKYLALLGANIAFAFLFGPSVGAGLSSFGLNTPLFAAAGIAALGFCMSIFLLKESKTIITQPEVQYAALAKKAKLSDDEGEGSDHSDGEGEEADEDDVNIEEVEKPVNVPTVVLCCLSGFFNIFAFVSFSSMFAIYVDDKFQMSPLDVGFVFSGAGVVVIVTQAFFFNLLSPKIGLPGTIMLGGAFLCAGLQTIPAATEIWHVVVSACVTAAGTAFVSPSTSSIISRCAPKSKQGTVLGYGQMSESAARVVGPLVLGQIYLKGDDIRADLPFQLAGAVGALDLIIGFTLAMRLRSTSEDTSEVDGGDEDPPRPSTRRERARLGQFLATMLEERGYQRWNDPRYTPALYRLLSNSFPAMPEDKKQRGAHVKELLERSDRQAEEWNAAKTVGETIATVQGY